MRLPMTTRFSKAMRPKRSRTALVYAEQLWEVVPCDRTVRMLDFGCGTGTFTARFIKKVGWQPDRLRLTLVEPVEAVRREAVARLAGMTAAPIVDTATFPVELAKSFDIVLANHCLYYVPGLREQMVKLVGRCRQAECSWLRSQRAQTP